MPSKHPGIWVRMKKPAHDLIAQIASDNNLTINEYMIKLINKELATLGHPIIVPVNYRKPQKQLEKC